MTSPINSATDAAAARARLLELIKELAVVRGKVILSSGAEADYYIDLRRITLHHEASKLVGQVMLALTDDAGIDFECAGGLTMGADPVGTAVMHAAVDAGRAVDAFVVRKAQKSYGMGRQVEGPSVEGRKVLVLEDTSTTGGSGPYRRRRRPQGRRERGGCGRHCGPGHRRQGKARSRDRCALPVRLRQGRAGTVLAGTAAARARGCAGPGLRLRLLLWLR